MLQWGGTKNILRTSVSKCGAINFAKRHSLPTVSLSRERDSSSTQQAKKDVAELRERLIDFALENILTVNQTLVRYNPDTRYSLKLREKRLYNTKSERSRIKIFLDYSIILLFSIFRETLMIMKNRAKFKRLDTVR